MSPQTTAARIQAGHHRGQASHCEFCPTFATFRRTSGVSSIEGLLAATAHGDRRSFSELYRLTHRRLYAIALALLHRPEAAEDVLQDTYLAVWRTAGQYQPGRAPALIWLMAIVRHRAIEQLRRRRRRALETFAEPLDEETLRIPDPSQPQAVNHLAHAIQECLRRLSAEQAQTIALAFSMDSATKNWRRICKLRSARSKAGCDGACCNSRSVWNHEPPRSRKPGR